MVTLFMSKNAYLAMFMRIPTYAYAITVMNVATDFHRTFLFVNKI